MKLTYGTGGVFSGTCCDWGGSGLNREAFNGASSSAHICGAPTTNAGGVSTTGKRSSSSGGYTQKGM